MDNNNSNIDMGQNGNYTWHQGEQPTSYEASRETCGPIRTNTAHNASDSRYSPYRRQHPTRCDLAACHNGRTDLIFHNGTFPESSSDLVCETPGSVRDRGDDLWQNDHSGGEPEHRNFDQETAWIGEWHGHNRTGGEPELDIDLEAAWPDHWPRGIRQQRSKAELEEQTASDSGRREHTRARARRGNSSRHRPVERLYQSEPATRAGSRTANERALRHG
jgi:hypothetical protein